MKALIPAAGQGTRLYPQTHTKPKAMVRLAGRPILGHIISNLADTDIEDVVIVVGGPMRDQIVEYATSEFGQRFRFEFVEQEQAKGVGHSIYQAEEALRGNSVLIALGDMLFESGYQRFLKAHSQLNDVEASIGLKEVEEPHHYGVAKVGDGRITRLVEKPDDPISNLAISGVYIIEDTPSLFDSLAHLVQNDIRGADDEYQLTDAFQMMIEDGHNIESFEVENWYDCGRPETLLEANRVLLAELDTSVQNGQNTVLVNPVDVGDDVEIEESVVGPDVSIDDGAKVMNSLVRDSIVGRGAVLESVNIESSIIGDNTRVRSETNQLNVGDNSTIDL